MSISLIIVFFFKQKTAYEMRMSDWSSDVCSSELFAVDATFPDPHLDGITAQGQAAGETADATDWSPTISFTAGQVISTLDDLELWAHALFTGEGVLDPETQQMRRASILTPPPPNTENSGQCLGFGPRNRGGGHAATGRASWREGVGETG